eukprot:2667850-Prymnesium_polylepis.1
MNPTSGQVLHTRIVLSAIDLLGYQLRTSAQGEFPRPFARGLTLPSRQKNSKAALRAVAGESIRCRRKRTLRRRSAPPPSALTWHVPQVPWALARIAAR